MAERVTWKQLFKKPQTLQLPFRLALADEEDFVLCQKMVRILPKKRIVFSGHWKNQAVIVKLFLEPGRAAAHFDRERSGIQILAESGIPTPALLYHGQTKRYRIPVLVTEELTDAKDIATLWEPHLSAGKQSARLMDKLVLELATQHVMGIRQRDLHFGNFMYKNHKIYTLDGGSMDFYQKPLPEKASLQHLALFFSQLGTNAKELKHRLLSIYTHARGQRLRKSALRYLLRMTQKHLHERIRRYQKKVLRASRHVQTGSRFGLQFWYDKRFASPELTALLQNPDVFFSDPKTQILKNGRSSTVIQAGVGEQTFVIKHYNIKNSLHWLRRCFRPSRARHSWQMAYGLGLAGIATARPVACIEKHFLGLRGRSFFVMEHIQGNTLTDHLRTVRADSPEALQLARRIQVLFDSLYEAGFCQNDLKATNIMIHKDHPVLIDLDGMQHFSPEKNNFRKNKKSIERFMKNWHDRPDLIKLFERENTHASPIQFCAQSAQRGLQKP